MLAVPLAYYVPLVLGPVGIGELAAIAGRETIAGSSAYDWEYLWEAPGYLLNACVLVLPLGFWTLHEYRQVRNVRMQSDALLLRFCSASAVASVLLLLLSASRPRATCFRRCRSFSLLWGRRSPISPPRTNR